MIPLASTIRPLVALGAFALLSTTSLAQQQPAAQPGQSGAQQGQSGPQQQVMPGPGGGPGFQNRGPMGGPGAGPMMGPGQMGQHMGQMGQGPQGPMGPGNMGPGNMGPMGHMGQMGQGPGGEGPMGQSQMGQGPMGQGPMGPGMMHGQGPMGPGMMRGAGPMCSGMGPGMGPGMGMGRGMGQGCPMMGGGGGAGMPDFTAGRLAFIRAELGITEAQQPQFEAFAEAFKKNFASMQETRMAMMSAMQQEKGPVDRLDTHLKAMEKRLGTLKEFKAAVDKLYGTLSDRQKAIADQIVPGMMGGMMMGPMGG